MCVCECGSPAGVCVAHLQVCDVAVYVHGRGHTVHWDVFVVLRTRLSVLRVDAGDGDPLVTPGDVPAQETGNGKQEAAEG